MAIETVKRKIVFKAKLSLTVTKTVDVPAYMNEEEARSYLFQSGKAVPQNEYSESEFEYIGIERDSDGATDTININKHSSSK